MTTSSNKPDLIDEENDWDFARQKNRELVEKTLGHLPWLLWLNLVPISVGVLLILCWALRAIITPAQQTPAIVIGLLGVLALLIGAVCLIVYRSTLVQARGYISEPLTTSEWEAARRKIQYYMHENLNQVRWIFWLTLVAMFLGFLIILCGAALAIIVQTQLASSIVVTLSGVLVEFLGATFLIIYKSTMEQARGYVNILERINNVGMSVRLIERINCEGKRDGIRAQMASEILSLHAVDKNEEKE